MVCLETSDSTVDWPNWALCQNFSKEGWFTFMLYTRGGQRMERPDQILNKICERVITNDDIKDIK